MRAARRPRPWAVDGDRITDATLLGFPRSEHSAQAEMLDMQEVTGSSPVSPTITPIEHEMTARWRSLSRRRGDEKSVGADLLAELLELHHPGAEALQLIGVED